jgi:hypothetical protein
MRCSTCSVELDRGFLPDFGMGATWAAVWVRGTPETQKGVREWFKTGGGVSLGDNEVRAVRADRCPTCGRLELFAIDVPDVGSTPAR